MTPRVTFLTLAVNNLTDAITFYEDGLGFQTGGVVGTEFHDELTDANGTIAFIKLQNGLIIGLYERTNLAKDAFLSVDKSSSTEFSVGIALDSKQQVDAVLKKAVAAGAILTKEPHVRPWGVYSGYIKDIDGHLWEITYDSQNK